MDALNELLQSPAFGASLVLVVPVILVRVLCLMPVVRSVMLMLLATIGLSLPARVLHLMSVVHSPSLRSLCLLS